MSPADRDWDKELADIDKVIARAPATPGGPAALPAAQAPASRPVAAPPGGKRAALWTWTQVILGGLLAVGMTQWPYFHGCGIKLFLYLGAAALVVVAGLWGALSSWRRRWAWPTRSGYLWCSPGWSWLRGKSSPGWAMQAGFDVDVPVTELARHIGISSRGSGSLLPPAFLFRNRIR